MNSEPSSQQEMGDDNDSQHFPGPTQDKTIRDNAMDFKNHSYLISPAVHSFTDHRRAFQSPLLYRMNFPLLEEDPSRQVPSPNEPLPNRG